MQAYSGTGGTVSAQVLLTDSATVLSSGTPAATGADFTQSPLRDPATVEAASVGGDHGSMDRVLDEDVIFDAEDVLVDVAPSPEQLDEGTGAPTGAIMIYLASVRSNSSDRWMEMHGQRSTCRASFGCILQTPTLPCTRLQTVQVV